MKNKTLKQYYLIGIIVSFFLVLLDQFTKGLAVDYLKDTEGVDIIAGIFKLEYVENRGAAFGMMQGQQTFFVISTTIVLIGVIYIYSRIPVDKKFHYLRACMIALSAGAVGNFIDRITMNYVVDFLYFELIDFPVFNVADIYVTVTMAIFLLLMLFYYKEEDLDRIHLLPKRKK